MLCSHISNYKVYLITHTRYSIRHHHQLPMQGTAFAIIFLVHHFLYWLWWEGGKQTPQIFLTTCKVQCCHSYSDSQILTKRRNYLYFYKMMEFIKMTSLQRYTKNILIRVCGDLWLLLVLYLILRYPPPLCSWLVLVDVGWVETCPPANTIKSL